MATVQLYGPYSWVQPAGENALMPNEEHVWAIGTFAGVVFNVTAHPDRHRPVQALAVTDLSVAYESTGAANLNFNVRNVSINGVLSYRLFISEIDF